MLLFSTILEIDNKLTKDEFVRLVIEWNQKGHPSSVIAVSYTHLTLPTTERV